MPELSPAARAAMPYWSVIEAAAVEGWTTADLWQAIRDTAEEYGLDSPGVSAAGVSTLRGLAGSIQRSGREFQRATADLSLTAQHMADAPWSRPLAEQNALGIWQVRYEHTFVTPEGPQTEWRSSMFQGSIPGTIGELAEAIEQDGEQLADKYGTGHVSVGSIQILRV